MGYNRPPERDMDEPHHQELSFVLKAKRDLLGEVARMYAHGACTQADLEEMACEFCQAALAVRLHDRDKKRAETRGEK